MGSLRDALRQLKALDTQLFELRHKVRDKQQQVTQGAKRLDALRTEAAARKDAAQRQQVETDRVNLDVQAREARLNKLRDALNSARTNKDYATILSEINEARAEQEKIEDTMLHGQLRVDELRKQETELRTQIEQAETWLAGLRQVLETEVGLHQPRMTALQTERDAIMGRLDAEQRHRYERISEYHEGDCLAAVEYLRQGRELDYVCGGCQVNIRHEQVNALMTRDDLQICDQCGRILVLTDAAPPEPEPVARPRRTGGGRKRKTTAEPPPTA